LNYKIFYPIIGVKHSLNPIKYLSPIL